MDSDLSLIEISGEDDSLLQPISSGACFSNSENGGRNRKNGDYFLCSPLQVTRSISKPIEAMAANKENFSVDSANKENFNVEKPEILKLSVEPQQMKRKKKGGGYNLRKSLAWDRAFFTEEGVLDASELSMISGNFSKSGGQMLPAIQEESSGTASDLQTLEENLFKELPVTKKVGANLSQKKRNNEVLTSMASRKVLSTHDVNRSGSKRSACPRPLASSSTLKRPANSVASKASEKDPKDSKPPVSKLHPPAPSRIGKSSIPTSNVLRRSQITRPGSNTTGTTLKNSGLKVSSNSTKSVPSNSKAGPAGKSLSTKSSLGKPKRNVVTSVKCSPAGGQLPRKTAENNSLAMNTSQSSSIGYASALGDGGSAKIAVPPSQHAEIETAKPTGLRMPSPSLGFFSQSTAVAQSPSKLTSQPCQVPQSSMSNMRKFGIPTPVSSKKPPIVPRNLPIVTIDATTENIKASGSSSRTSTFPTFSSALHGIIESNPQVTNTQLVEEKVKSGETSYTAIKVRNNLQGLLAGVDQHSLGRAEECSSNGTLAPENMTLPKKVTEVVDRSIKGTEGSESENLHSTNPSGSLMGYFDPSGQSHTTEVKLAQSEPCSSSLKDHGFSLEFTSGKSNVEQLPGEQADVTHLLSCEAGSTFNDCQMLQEKDADTSHLRCTEQEKEDLSITAEETRQSNAEDLGAPLLHVDNRFLSEKSFSPGEAKQENFLLCSGSGGKHTHGSKLNRFSDPCLSPFILLDRESDVAKVVECQNHEGGPSAFKDINPIAESYNSNTQSQHDVEIHGETALMEMENMEEHRLADVSSVENVNGTCQNSGQENSNIISSPSLMALLEGDTSTDHADHVDVEDKKLNLSVESLSHNINPQPEYNFCHEDKDSSVKQICVLGGGDDLYKRQEDQDKQMTNSCGDIGRLVYERNPCPEADCFTFEGIHPLEEPKWIGNGNTGSGYQEVNSCGSGSKMDCVLQGLGEVNYVVEKQDKKCEFQHLNNQTEVDSSVRVSGVGLGPVSQEDYYVEVFNKESEIILEYRCDYETEKMDEFRESAGLNDVTKEQYAGSDLQDPVDQTEEVPPPSFPRIYINNVTQENGAEVVKKESDFENVVEQGDNRGIKPKISITYGQKMQTSQDDDLDKNKEADRLKVEVLVTRDLEIKPSFEKLQFSQKQKTENKLSKANFSNPESGAKQSHDQASVEFTVDREDQDANGEPEKTSFDKKQETLVIKPPANCVPFSDEWLAALESAGEEILTMKSGAVQNSPQDRSQPEPGPWSPVKRKHHQTLGPFDCTKHTNH